MAKMVTLTHYDTGKEISLRQTTDIVAIEELAATENHKERTAVRCSDGRDYLVKESAAEVRKLFKL